MRPVQNPAEIGEPTHAFVAVAGLVVSCAPVDVKVVVLEELNVAPTVNAVLAEGTEVAGEATVLQPVGAQGVRGLFEPTRDVAEGIFSQSENGRNGHEGKQATRSENVQAFADGEK